MPISGYVARLCGWFPGAFASGVLIGSHCAMAAPFCLTNLSVPPQCMYYDANQCSTEAARQGSWCVPNPSQTQVGTGSGQYCLITSQGASQCVYLDRSTCAAEATRQHGVCYHDEARAAGTPDPYASSSGPYAVPAPAETP